ncbi:unnamed protein product [Phytophthora fragariaefolia]|uniref:Unnamed protein product n=1 Tax=Phytophthora fragariaefolia TaxID=1490495 RepID=A0A9W6WT37_9STRA|nr:unnamed protein product [Phytophthora fragariaefolia]
MRESPALTRQQQAEAKRVTIRTKSRAAHEVVEPLARWLPAAKHGPKRLTPYQEHVLSEMNGDRLPQGAATGDKSQEAVTVPSSADHDNGARWEAVMLEALQAEEQPRSSSSSSVNSEELNAMMYELTEGLDRARRKDSSLRRKGARSRGNVSASEQDDEDPGS